MVINVSLLLDEVLSITLSYKENNKEIKCFVDIDKYITKGHFRCDNKIYNKEINEYRVPHLKEIINLSIKMSKELNVNNELKWSYCLSDSGKIYYMDTDNFDDLEFIQIPEYLNNNIGFLPRYIKAVKRTK